MQKFWGYVLESSCVKISKKKKNVISALSNIKKNQNLYMYVGSFKVWARPGKKKGGKPKYKTIFKK